MAEAVVEFELEHAFRRFYKDITFGEVFTDPFIVAPFDSANLAVHVEDEFDGYDVVHFFYIVVDMGEVFAVLEGIFDGAKVAERNFFDGYAFLECLQFRWDSAGSEEGV